MAPGPEKPQEQPKQDATKIMGEFMPADSIKLDSTPKTKTEVSKEEIDKASKGYPKASPGKYPDIFQICKDKAATNLNAGEKWHAGTVVPHQEAVYNDSDKMFHIREYVLVTGNKTGEYHFFRAANETTRPPNSDEQRDIDQQAAANQKEVDDLDEADREETLDKLLKGSPEPATVAVTDELAKQVNKDLKLRKGDSWTAAYRDKGDERVVGFLTASGAKVFYKGERKA